MKAPLFKKLALIEHLESFVQTKAGHLWWPRPRLGSPGDGFGLEYGEMLGGGRGKGHLQQRFIGTEVGRCQ